MSILPGITCLLQYLNYIKFILAECKPKFCSHCGNLKVWGWGFYYREAYRRGGSFSMLDPIPIQRFYCPSCHRTTSILPECMSPRRWYLWQQQQEVILLCLAGASLSKVSRQAGPSRSTARRWLVWVQDQFRYHKDAICSHWSGLGLANNYADFWQNCFQKTSLARGMYLCGVAGVSVP